MVTTQPRARSLSRQAGFTLIEVLMATTITTAIMGSIVLVTSQLSRSYYSQLDGAAVQQEGRFALDWIVRTLTSAGANPLRITTSPCPAAGNTFRAIRRDPDANGVQNDIRIHSDLNGNKLLGGVATGTGTCIEPDEDVTIAYLAGAQAWNGTITKFDNNIDVQAVAMSDAVISGLTFAYLDCNRAATASDAAVCFIQVTVTAQTPTLNSNNGLRTTYTSNAEVRVRTR